MVLTALLMLLLVNCTAGFRISTNTGDPLFKTTNRDNQVNGIVHPVKNSLSAISKPSIPDCPWRQNRCPPVRPGCAWETYSVDDNGSLCRDCDDESCNETHMFMANLHLNKVMKPPKRNWIPMEVKFEPISPRYNPFNEGGLFENHRKGLHDSQQENHSNHNLDVGEMGEREIQNNTSKQIYHHNMSSATSRSYHSRTKIAPNKSVKKMSSLDKEGAHKMEPILKIPVSRTKLEEQLQSVKQLHQYFDHFHRRNYKLPIKIQEPYSHKRNHILNHNNLVHDMETTSSFNSKLWKPLKESVKKEGLNFSNLKPSQYFKNKQEKVTQNKKLQLQSSKFYSFHKGNFKNPLSKGNNSDQWYSKIKNSQINLENKVKSTHPVSNHANNLNPKEGKFWKKAFMQNFLKPTWVKLGKDGYKMFSKSFPSQTDQGYFKGNSNMGLNDIKYRPDNTKASMPQYNLGDAILKYEQKWANLKEKASESNDSNSTMPDVFKKISYLSQHTGERKDAYIDLTRVKKIAKLLSYIRSKSEKEYKKVRDLLASRYELFYQFQKPHGGVKITRRSVKKIIPSSKTWETSEEVIDEMLSRESHEIEILENLKKLQEELVHDNKEYWQDSISKSIDLDNLIKLISLNSVSSEENDATMDFKDSSSTLESTIDAEQLESNSFSSQAFSDEREKRSILPEKVLIFLDSKGHYSGEQSDENFNNYEYNKKQAENYGYARNIPNKNDIFNNQSSSLTRDEEDSLYEENRENDSQTKITSDMSSDYSKDIENKNSQTDEYEKNTSQTSIEITNDISNENDITIGKESDENLQFKKYKGNDSETSTEITNDMSDENDITISKKSDKNPQFEKNKGKDSEFLKEITNNMSNKYTITICKSYENSQFEKYKKNDSESTTIKMSSENDMTISKESDENLQFEKYKENDSESKTELAIKMSSENNMTVSKESDENPRFEKYKENDSESSIELTSDISSENDDTISKESEEITPEENNMQEVLQKSMNR